MQTLFSNYLFFHTIRIFSQMQYQTVTNNPNTMLLKIFYKPQIWHWIIKKKKLQDKQIQIMLKTYYIIFLVEILLELLKITQEDQLKRFQPQFPMFLEQC